MKRILAAAFISVIALAVLTVVPNVAPNTVSASGSGGAISLGAVVGSGNSKDVTVVTGVATNSWSGYNIHVAAEVGGGLVLDSITAVNGPLLTGNPFCFNSDFGLGEHIFGCTALGATRPAIVAAGTLAMFTFNTTGNGCLVVKLVTLPGNATKDTYTIDRASTTPQTNVVNTAPIKLLVGTGQISDCPPVYGVGGVAEEPDMTALPAAASSGRNQAGYIVGAAGALFVAVIGASGWRKRRR